MVNVWQQPVTFYYRGQFTTNIKNIAYVNFIPRNTVDRNWMILKLTAAIKYDIECDMDEDMEYNTDKYYQTK